MSWASSQQNQKYHLNSHSHYNANVLYDREQEKDVLHGEQYIWWCQKQLHKDRNVCLNQIYLTHPPMEDL